MLYITRSPSLGPRELLLLIPPPAKAVPYIAHRQIIAFGCPLLRASHR